MKYSADIMKCSRGFMRGYPLRKRRPASQNLGGCGLCCQRISDGVFWVVDVVADQRPARVGGQPLQAGGETPDEILTFKIYEWHHEITSGYTIGDEFFSFYYALTGIHLAHLALGLLVLGIVTVHLRGPAIPHSERIGIAEQGALYWHMIDLLWTVIFAILYLMRRQVTESSTAPTRFARDKRVVVAVWAALAVITVLAWQLTPGHTRATASLSKELIAAIVVLGAIKSRLIIRYFMEIRHAPRWLRVATDAWVVVLWAALLATYLWP
ncbi:cytochrome C oxidase subunit IV family protein [Nocardia sp. NPDC003482]